jgi:hypothetical protein
MLEDAGVEAVLEVGHVSLAQGGMAVRACVLT